VRSRREYLALQREGRRRTTPHFVLLVRPRSNGASRLGITVSRKVGDAVTRNHVKRCIREWFRRHSQQITPVIDLVVIARPGASELSCPAIGTELTKSVLRADKLP
jgi:ribonuclease P protein component